MATPIFVPFVNCPLTGNGSSNGFCTVSTTNAGLLQVGATVNINDNTNTIAAQAIITSIVTTTGVIGLRLTRLENTIINGYQTYNGAYQQLNYGRSNLSAYTTANSAYILCPQQVVFNTSAAGDDAGRGAPQGS